MKTKTSQTTIKYVTDVLTFGKHKGKSVEWVLNNEPGYIVWLEEEKICDIEQEIYNLAQEFDEDNKNDWAWYIDVYDFMD